MWPFKSKYVLPALPEIKRPELDLLDNPPIPDMPQLEPGSLDLPSFKKPKAKAKLEVPATLEPIVVKQEEPKVNLGGINLWLSNGVVVKNLQDMREAMLAMNDATFHYHVNVERNDFASWIQDVLGDKDLAMKMANVHKRKDLLNILEKRLNPSVEKNLPEIKSTAENQKFAYLGLRGMTSMETATDLIGFKSRGSKVTRGKIESKVPEPALIEQKKEIAAPKKRYEVKDDPKSAREGLSNLQSMEDVNRLLTKIQPKGNMLKEMLSRKSQEPPKQEVHQIFLPKHDEPLEITDQHEIIQKPKSTFKNPEILRAIGQAQMPAPVPKKVAKKNAKDMILERIEEAKNAATNSNLSAAKKMLKEAKQLAKQMKLDKKFLYEFWEAENSIKLLQVA